MDLREWHAQSMLQEYRDKYPDLTQREEREIYAYYTGRRFFLMFRCRPYREPKTYTLVESDGTEVALSIPCGVKGA